MAKKALDDALLDDVNGGIVLNELNQKTDLMAQKTDLMAQKTDLLAQKNDLLAQKNDLLAQKVDELAQKVDMMAQKTDMMAPVASPYGFLKEAFPSEYYTELVRHVFEDTEVPITAHSDAVLSQLYGNYMELPPEGSRFSSIEKTEIRFLDI